MVATVTFVTRATLVTKLTRVPTVIRTSQKSFRSADIVELVLQFRRQNNYIRIACYKMLSKNNKMQTVCISCLKTSTTLATIVGMDFWKVTYEVALSGALQE